MKLMNYKSRKKIFKLHLEVPLLVKSWTLDALAIEMHALILNYSKCINISPCMFGGCATPFEHECWWIPPWGCGGPARPSLSSWRSHCSFWGESSQREGARPTTVAHSREKCRWISNQCERGAFCLYPSLPHTAVHSRRRQLSSEKPNATRYQRILKLLSPLSLTILPFRWTRQGSWKLSQHLGISGTAWLTIMKFCMHNLHFLWMIYVKKKNDISKFLNFTFSEEPQNPCNYEFALRRN